MLAKPTPSSRLLGARDRTLLSVLLLSLAALGATASLAAVPKARDLPKSPSQYPTVAKLLPATTYKASLITPTPAFTPSVQGWAGAQFDSHQAGKVRFENATLFWKDAQHELDIVAGPAMTLSPAEALAKPLARNFNFAPYNPPTTIKRWTVAGRPALYFDATAPPPGEWTVIGANPPELRIDHDNSFRMTALTVRGKTVVIVIHGPVADYRKYLPAAIKLIGSLRFPSA